MRAHRVARAERGGDGSLMLPPPDIAGAASRSVGEQVERNVEPPVAPGSVDEQLLKEIALRMAGADAGKAVVNRQEQVDDVTELAAPVRNHRTREWKSDVGHHGRFGRCFRGEPLARAEK